MSRPKKRRGHVKIFKRKARSQEPVVQLRSGQNHPFSELSAYVPLLDGEMRLYRLVREAIPAIDAAIVKLIRLSGGVTATCGDKVAERELQEFLRTVNVGNGQRGINAFLDKYLESLMVCGWAVGEMVLNRRREPVALLCGNSEDLHIKPGATPLDFKVCQWNGRKVTELPNQELLYFTPFMPETAHPYGVSLLRSMPFMAEILVKIYHTLGVNWDRAGNVRFAVVCKPKGDGMSGVNAAERANEIAREWSAAMQSGRNGTVRDFVAVGDVEVKVIGADGPILDSEIPVRQILEQLIARTGIPPFMLGFSWSSTERMSSQQADILTSEITAIRRNVEPVVERICEMWLRCHGYDCRPTVQWDPINLQDETEEAHAELYLAEADYYRAQTRRLTKEMRESHEGN